MKSSSKIMSSKLKCMVSKNRKRFQQDGYDLDLTYILDKKLCAMGYPGEKIEGLYRNNIEEVVKFFEERHPGRYKIYNLCEERTYNASKFKTGQVVAYPFVDHNPPQMDIIPSFCQDVHEWLSQHQDNVAAVHCKAGKGRTGLMICCYLLHCGACRTAKDALEYYADKRTDDSKGVTIPSQQRYVGYYEHLLTQSPTPKVVYRNKPLNLTTIRLQGHLLEHTKVILQFTLRSPEIVYTSSPIEWKYGNCPSGKRSGAGATTSTSTSATSTSSSTDSHIHQPLAENPSNLSSYTTTCGFYSTTNHLSIELDEPLLLSGDVKLQIYTKPMKLMKRSKLCHCWFNTYFVDGIQQQQAASLKVDRNGCNNSEDDSANCGGNNSSSNHNKNGSCSAKNQDTIGPVCETLTSQPASGGISKRDSASENNCCSVKVKFSKDLQPRKQRSKQIDRTMSCPPPSDTTRPRIPSEWIRDPPVRPPDEPDQDPSRTPTNASKQPHHYTMMFSKLELDKAHKDKGKNFSSDFAVHLIFTDSGPSSNSSDYLSTSISSHASRSSFAGSGGGGGSSSSSSATINQNAEVSTKKLNKMFPDHHQHQRASGGHIKPARTTSDMMAHLGLGGCIGAEEEDDYVFRRDPQKGLRNRNHGNTGGSGSSDGAPTDSSGGVRLNRNHSSTSSCSSSSNSSGSCSENNSSCSNSSSTENCSQVVHHNNNKK